MRFLTTIICILPFVYTLPVQQQEAFKLNEHRIEQVPSAPFMESAFTIDEIQDNYSQIINQVMTETIQDIKDVAQDSLMTIHQLQIIGKEYCRTSIDDFIQTLDTKLKQAKFQLITASATLIEDNREDIVMDPSSSSELISHKLDMILNPETLSKDIVQSSMSQEHFELIKYLIHGKKYYLMNRHEKNEAVALYAWIHSWLADIKYSLKREFDLYLQESGVMKV